MLIHLWALHALKNLGWIVALGLAICCALRLARFNVAIDQPDKPPYAINFFTGAPAPAGAGLAMAPMYVGFLLGAPGGEPFATVILPYIAAVAILMVSRIPTFSGKAIGKRIHRDMVLPALGIAAFVVLLLISFTWEMLTIFAALYIACLPLGVRSFLRQKKAHDDRMAQEPANA